MCYVVETVFICICIERNMQHVCGRSPCWCCLLNFNLISWLLQGCFSSSVAYIKHDGLYQIGVHVLEHWSQECDWTTWGSACIWHHIQGAYITVSSQIIWRRNIDNGQGGLGRIYTYRHLLHYLFFIFDEHTKFSTKHPQTSLSHR